jgi:integrase/recombinase XerD
MTDLRAAAANYLILRRGLGFKLVDAGWLLPGFVDYLERHGADHVTTELALAWAKLPANTDPVWWRQRLGIVRGFAEYLHTIDPATEVPPHELLPARQHRVAPYIYSDTDIAALMTAAHALKPALRGDLRDVHRVVVGHRPKVG